jgi:hypothetical protein
VDLKDLKGLEGSWISRAIVLVLVIEIEIEIDLNGKRLAYWHAWVPLFQVSVASGYII